MPSGDMLSIQRHTEGDLGFIDLSGRLVAESRFDFKKEMREAMDAGLRRAVVTLRDLEYIDSAGLAALIGDWKRLREIGGEMVLAEVNPKLKALFEISSIEKFFKTFPTFKQAVMYLRQLTPNTMRSLPRPSEALEAPETNPE